MYLSKTHYHKCWWPGKGWRWVQKQPTTDLLNKVGLSLQTPSGRYLPCLKR